MRETCSSSTNHSGDPQDRAVENNISSEPTFIHNLSYATPLPPVDPHTASITIENLRATLDATASIYTVSTQLSDSVSTTDSFDTSQETLTNRSESANTRTNVFSSTTAPCHNPMHLGTLPYFYPLRMIPIQHESHLLLIHIITTSQLTPLLM